MIVVVGLTPILVLFGMIISNEITDQDNGINLTVSQSQQSAFKSPEKYTMHGRAEGSWKRDNTRLDKISHYLPHKYELRFSDAELSATADNGNLCADYVRMFNKNVAAGYPPIIPEANVDGQLGVHPWIPWIGENKLDFLRNSLPERYADYVKPYKDVRDWRNNTVERFPSEMLVRPIPNFIVIPYINGGAPILVRYGRINTTSYPPTAIHDYPYIASKFDQEKYLDDYLAFIQHRGQTIDFDPAPGSQSYVRLFEYKLDQLVRPELDLDYLPPPLTS